MSNEIVKKDEMRLDVSQGFGISLEGLSDEQKQSVIAKVQDAKIELAKDVAKRQIRLNSSSADMDVTVNTANRLEQGKNDYKISSNHETASGRTEIQVSRNTNNGMLIVIVIIGIVLILTLLKAL